ALGERCVGLVLDSLGYVIDVAPDASDAVFGFPPKQLMGRHVSTFVDILSPQQARKAAAPAAPPNASLGGIQALLQGRKAQDHALDPGEAAVCKEDEEQVAQLLLELVGRSTEMPGITWRCGVSRSHADTSTPSNIKGMAAILLGRMQASYFMVCSASACCCCCHVQTKPAIMSLGLVLESTLSPQPSKELISRMHGPAPDPFKAPGAAPSPHSSPERGQGGKPPLCDLDALGFRGSQGPSNTRCLVRYQSIGTTQPHQRRTSVMNVVADGGQTLRYSLKLWRSKLSCSVMEVDRGGRVVPLVNDEVLGVLYPSTLVLGCSYDDVYGQSIASILPLGPRGVAHLYDSLPAAASQKKGLLKGLTQSDKKPGPVQLLKVTNRADERDTMLSVQAVPKLGRSGHTYLIMHAHEPLCGRQDFITWVQGGGLKESPPSPGRRHLNSQISRK
ncbi:hypothetical protein QJQ45_023343, partial [Haematococcus lacustris]